LPFSCLHHKLTFIISGKHKLLLAADKWFETVKMSVKKGLASAHFLLWKIHINTSHGKIKLQSEKYSNCFVVWGNFVLICFGFVNDMII
jgi:hypothetical protein